MLLMIDYPHHFSPAFAGFRKHRQLADIPILFFAIVRHRSVTTEKRGGILAGIKF